MNIFVFVKINVRVHCKSTGYKLKELVKTKFQSPYGNLRDHEATYCGHSCLVTDSWAQPTIYIDERLSNTFTLHTGYSEKHA